MRINLFITELRTGGAERCLTELALGLARRGDDVRVLSLAPLPLPPRNELVERLLAAGIPVESCGVRRSGHLVAAVRYVRNWLRESEPDCLQTFLYHANVVGAIAAGRRPYSRVVAGVRVAQPHRGRVWFESRWKRRLSGIVCVSRAVEAFVQRHWRPHPPTRVVTIPNAIEKDRFVGAAPVDWSQWGLQGDGPVVLFLGRLHRQKGLDLLLDVAPTLLQLHPDMRLAIVGEGPLRSAVTRTISELPDGRAALLPWQSEVGGLYAGCRLVLLPSRYEGMPNVVLEAMSAGRCVLAADVEGVSELLGPLAGEQTFPPGDRGSMVQRLDSLLRRPDLEQLQQANRQRVASEFSPQAMVDRYRTFYLELLDRPL